MRCAAAPRRRRRSGSRACGRRRGDRISGTVSRSSSKRRAGITEVSHSFGGSMQNLRARLDVRLFDVGLHHPQGKTYQTGHMQPTNSVQSSTSSPVSVSGLTDASYHDADDLSPLCWQPDDQDAADSVDLAVVVGDRPSPIFQQLQIQIQEADCRPPEDPLCINVPGEKTMTYFNRMKLLNLGKGLLSRFCVHC
eukprot:SAG31_NODE_14825_length_785_cov_1.795918_1_plen_194_part_00